MVRRGVGSTTDTEKKFAAGQYTARMAVSGYPEVGYADPGGRPSNRWLRSSSAVRSIVPRFEWCPARRQRKKLQAPPSSPHEPRTPASRRYRVTYDCGTR